MFTFNRPGLGSVILILFIGIVIRVYNISAFKKPFGALAAPGPKRPNQPKEP